MSEVEGDRDGKGVLPRHIAIIMDGNGRWAKERGQARHKGHQAGAEAAREVIATAGELGVPVLSLFAFSSENWSRPATEVNRLMDLFRRALKQALPKLHENGVRVRFLGDRRRFPEDLQTRMAEAEALTADNQSLTLNICAGYGGRWDILESCRRLARDVAAGKLNPEDIDESGFAAGLSLADVPAPDLFIRTGGERRLSNFFLWDLAYTELYFSERLWPDFGGDALREAVTDFGERERRFGRVADNEGEASA
ncbi:polyprenyl diphosphate synthase [Gammaproteobacteria bacterium AB-CW1]|uniref:Ditrans,polycis-undecaprenyl-diphosphate synthase ((2E,6E)-farnesyl-diphosphate specific) n=1 Tax=Natronospira elongata TaxID=3110268 RepID=A0AAP6JCK0_9GAMM|nr:polyprenyl diphosphate synthase [Gammaproteobacteria bacterium AB-CW1]